MTTFSVIQPSFAAGELSPFLHGRVDLAKFHVGARTMLNMFVHPHGGASNRPGTLYIGDVGDHAVRHRLIPFRFRSSPSGQTYILVFGHRTMQVVKDGGFVETVPGTLYSLPTPYGAADLGKLKFVQSADTLTLTHPNYQARTLTRTGHAAWTLTPIGFAPSTPAPTGLATSAPGLGHDYVVTAIADASGEESLQSGAVNCSTGTSTLNWAAVPGCSTYNVYKYRGSIWGFIAQVGTPSFTDSSLAPDIGSTPPQQRNPFGAAPLGSVSIAAAGAGYSSPTLAIQDPTGSGATLGWTLDGSGGFASVTVTDPGQNYTNPSVIVAGGSGSGAAFTLNWAVGGQYVSGYQPGTYDSENGGYQPGPPIYSDWFYLSSVTVNAGGAGYGPGATFYVVYQGGVNYGGMSFTTHVSGGAVTGVTVVNPGTGQFAAGLGGFPTPAITDTSGGGAVLVAHLDLDKADHPACSTYFQQRQVFAGTANRPQTLWFSVAGGFNNMAVSQPTRDDDAITRTLVSREVNEIRHMVPGSSLLLMTSGAEWRCWPGPNSAGLTPGDCVTLPQSAYGSSHVPPISAGGAVLFVQERGSRVRELRFDALQDSYQATDMSVLSSHLLFDTTAQHTIEEWAWAEEPFRVVWAVRSDGTLLGFTYMREHEVFAWHRHQTDGAVESVASVPEQEGGSLLDAVYLIVRRTIDGQTRRYVERLAPRTFATLADAWFVDCGLKYDGAPATTISGLDHLEGKSVAILADGAVVPNKVVSGGSVTLDAACSKAIVGLPYTADLETLNLELPANGTIQGQMKKISKVTVRVKDTCGLKVGLNPVALQEVKKPQPFTGDLAVTVGSEWNTDGRVFVRQDAPLPVTVLDLIPEVTLGR